ncbi:proprotein convertase P-domain-containing protein [Parendozoicomonas sp. Alg238-R29]|uniref:proprotein convertase P-domain-containing protein n=1 Tax=Parendozoicomonas sp. Alg238-R29 TaxID=2993446 RepID=UPI00248E58F7|nr:proprotein convertase P-domain-containing protein [Parendozoicomonas sp. Alg238-R29]
MALVAVSVPEEQKVFGTRISEDIPDNRSRGVSVPVISYYQGDAGTVSVDVDITHPYIGDLQLVLIFPDGTQQTSKKQDSQENIAGLKETYEVDACGHPAGGEWKLKVSDHNRKGSGALNGRSIGFR